MALASPLLQSAYASRSKANSWLTGKLDDSTLLAVSELTLTSPTEVSPGTSLIHKLTLHAG